MTRYVLDANVFIQAKNEHYGFEFCPASWDWLEQANRGAIVASVSKVADELFVVHDDLARWAKEQGVRFFLSPDKAVDVALADVSDWVKRNEYDSVAVATFLRKADYWLVAHARAHNCTVVTHEKHANTVKKVKIPNVCSGLGLTCLTPYEMLRREQARFVLGSSDAGS